MNMKGEKGELYCHLVKITSRAWEIRQKTEVQALHPQDPEAEPQHFMTSPTPHKRTASIAILGVTLLGPQTPVEIVLVNSSNAVTIPNIGQPEHWTIQFV